MKISAEGATPNSEGRKPWINRHYLECEVCRTDTYYIILYLLDVAPTALTKKISP